MRSGQSLVEFALTVLLLSFLIAGSLQLGLAIYASWIVLPGAVQDGATVAARRGSTVAAQLEQGRQRTLSLLDSSGVGRLASLTVSAADLGDHVEIRASGHLPLVLPIGSLALRLEQSHRVAKEAIGGSRG